MVFICVDFSQKQIINPTQEKILHERSALNEFVFAVELNDTWGEKRQKYLRRYYDFYLSSKKKCQYEEFI